MNKSKRLYFCLLLFFLGSNNLLFAQQYYTVADSVAIYKLLDEADAEDLAGNLEKALLLTNKALTVSDEKKMLRGKAYSLLKIADLKLKKEGAQNILPLFDAPMRLALQLKDSALIGLTFQQKGQVYLNQTNYAEAELNYNQALLYYTEQNNPDYRAMIFNENGFINDRQGEFEKAAGMYLKALQLFEKLNNMKEAANTTGNLAVTNYRMGNKEEAIRLFKKSAQIREQTGDAKGLAATYGNLVVVYTAISLDSAFRYQELVLKYANKTGSKNNMAQANATAAALLTKQKKINDAVLFQQKAIELYEEAGDQLKLANQYIGMANLQQQLNDSVNAERYYAKAELVAQKQSNKPLYQNLYTQYADFYRQRNNFRQAYFYNQQAITYKDSIINEKTAANVADLQKKYETEKKDNEIARLVTEEKISKLQIEKQKALLAGSEADAKRKETQIQLLNQQQQLRDAELKQQKEELDKQVLQNKNSEQQLLLSVQQLQIADNEKKLRLRQLGQERLLRNGLIAGTVLLLLFGYLLFNRYQLRKKIEEQRALLEVRNKISKDLHDDIGSTLTSIHILSKVSQQAIEENPSQAKQMLRDIATQTKTIQQNMSDIVWAIRPDNDKVENLISRMREHIAQTLEPQGIKTLFDVGNEALSLSLPMQHRKELLLIYKEAIHNVLKHAGATEVHIRLYETMQQLQMVIQDNGSWRNKEKPSGTGMYSMKQRAESIGGTVNIKGTANGTLLTVLLPLP